MAGELLFVRKEENLEKEGSFRYALYQVDPPTDGGSEDLGKPLFVFDQPADRMSFIAMEAKIFMIGGITSRRGISVPSPDTYVLDSITYEFSKGPSMLSGKSRPILHKIGSKIYVMSRFIYMGIGRKGFDPPPHFEVLDTAVQEPIWTPLPLPFIFTSSSDIPRAVDGCCVSFGGYGSEFILLSLNKLGTYVFDTVDMQWEHVSGDILPFRGKAISIPPPQNAPSSTSSLSLAVSLRSNQYTAYQFNYVNKTFRVNEIEIEVDKGDLYSPPTLFNECLVTAVFDQRVYLLSSGFEDPESRFSGIGDLYIKVVALGLDKLEIENQGGFGMLKRCSTSTSRDREDEGEGRALKFKLRALWKKVIFGGPLSDQLEHLSQAFVI